MLYLSHFFKLHQREYYDRLMAVRLEGNWEGWLKFFLRGVAEVSNSATEKARAILRLQEEHRNLVLEKVSNAALGQRLLQLLQQPIISVRFVEKQLGCVFATANKLVEQFTASGILTERTGGQRNRQVRLPALPHPIRWHLHLTPPSLPPPPPPAARRQPRALPPFSPPSRPTPLPPHSSSTSPCPIVGINPSAREAGYAGRSKPAASFSPRFRPCGSL